VNAVKSIKLLVKIHLKGTDQEKKEKTAKQRSGATKRRREKISGDESTLMFLSVILVSARGRSDRTTLEEMGRRNWEDLIRGHRGESERPCSKENISIISP